MVTARSSVVPAIVKSEVDTMKARVFIGSSTDSVQIAEHVQSELEHDCSSEIWTNGKFRPGLTPIESLFLALDEFDFAGFVASPEDLTKKRGVDYRTMRDNVLFEAGLFLGRLGRDRVFLISPKGTELTLSLPSDLTGITPSLYDPKADNVRASVGSAINPLKTKLRAFKSKDFKPIFDSSTDLKPYQLILKDGYEWNSSGEKVSKISECTHDVTDEHMRIERKNSEGVFEIEIRPEGKGEPTIPRIKNSDRIFDIRFEGKVEGKPHKVKIVLIQDITYKWLDHHAFDIASTGWQPFARALKAPPGIDILVRLEEQIDGDPQGALFLRNITVKEYTTQQKTS